MDHFITELCRPGRYRAEIEKIHLKNAQTDQIHRIEYRGISLAQIASRPREFAKALAETIASQRYHIEPAVIRTITVNGKERILYQLNLTDRILHGVAATLLNELIADRLSPHLYSYIPGTNWWIALEKLATHIRTSTRENGFPDHFVLHLDVKSYTDTIPIHTHSLLWGELAQLLDYDPKESTHHYYWSLLQEIIRPTVSEGERSFTNLYGIPTGSPISTFLFNYYLLELDHTLDSVEGGYYARYSDDFLFMHPDPNEIQKARQKIHAILERRELRSNDEKSKLTYLTRAGKKSDAMPEARGTQKIHFLGCEVSAHGTIALDKKKTTSLLQEIDARCHKIATKQFRQLPLETRGKKLAQVIAGILRPNDHTAHKTATLLSHAINSRPCLKQIDYQIARKMLYHLLGSPHPRGFRQIPYRTMRSQWGLPSTVRNRNAKK